MLSHHRKYLALIWREYQAAAQSKVPHTSTSSIEEGDCASSERASFEVKEHPHTAKQATHVYQHVLHVLHIKFYVLRTLHGRCGASFPILYFLYMDGRHDTQHSFLQDIPVTLEVIRDSHDHHEDIISSWSSCSCCCPR